MGGYLSNLVTALQNLTTFLQTSPLATLTTAQPTTYTQLQPLSARWWGSCPRSTPALMELSPIWSKEDFLFSQVLPQYYQAFAQATIQLLTSNGFTASVRPRHRKGCRLRQMAAWTLSRWAGVRATFSS